MSAQQGPEFYCCHSTYTDPGNHAQDIVSLPDDPAALCQIVQGNLFHIAWADKYGLSGKTKLSRVTQPVSKRLTLIFNDCADALSVTRPPRARSPGTCRDFALMLCSIFRQKGIPARIRCGFAAYLAPERFEDHWICEYWKPEERRWAVADAQIDHLHQDILKITFDITDVPAGEFLNAGEAWSLVRKGGANMDAFGHGDACGQWFLRVNVIRDLLALHGQEVSAWDTWRSAKPEDKILEDDAIGLCDRIADATAHTPGVPDECDEIVASVRTPPWQH